MRFSRSLVVAGFLGALTVTLMQGIAAISRADVLHFHSGKVMQGKLSRVTGDLIEFAEGGGFGNLQVVRRLTLSNRRDVVETRRDERYFGEIIYVDKFKVDMQTATGMVKINRLLVKNVVMGTPMEQPGSPDMKRIPVNPTAPGGMNENTGMAPTHADHHTVVSYPPVSAADVNDADNNTSFAKSQPGEDEDAIPAVDRNY